MIWWLFTGVFLGFAGASILGVRNFERGYKEGHNDGYTEAIKTKRSFEKKMKETGRRCDERNSYK